jgi:hypothetical protein
VLHGPAQRGQCPALRALQAVPSWAALQWRCWLPVTAAGARTSAPLEPRTPPLSPPSHGAERPYYLSRRRRTHTNLSPCGESSSSSAATPHAATPPSRVPFVRSRAWSSPNYGQNRPECHHFSLLLVTATSARAFTSPLSSGA